MQHVWVASVVDWGPLSAGALEQKEALFSLGFVSGHACSFLHLVFVTGATSAERRILESVTRVNFATYLRMLWQ